jgi:hypothetical protein
MHARVLDTLASYTCFRAWRVPSFQQTLKCRVVVLNLKMHTIYTSLTLAGAAFPVLGYQPGRCLVYNFHHILVFGPGGWNASKLDLAGCCEAPVGGGDGKFAASCWCGSSEPAHCQILRVVMGVVKIGLHLAAD